MVVKSTNIEKHNMLKKERLDINHYTLSLMQEGFRVGLIDQSTLDSIQAQIMVLLRDSIMKYTKGESTSVKVETAQSILMSNLYTIDAYLSSFNHPEDAIEFLESDNNIKESYENGLEMLLACLEESKQLYQEIKTGRLPVQIEAYHSTIDEALPDFFRSYDVRYMAQDTMASIDYPLLFDDMSIQGIYYINQYLKKLSIETQFCRLFAEEDIERVLFNYGSVYGIDYREALINVFEILLTNSIFSVLTTNKAHELCISKLQYELLQEKFKDLDHSQCSALISEAIEALPEYLGIDQVKLRNYIRDFEPVLMPRFLNALEHDSLKNLIIVDSEEKHSLDIIFDEGKTMDNDSFRMLVEQIIECIEPAQKAEIIGSNIHSLGDFVDVLEADCLFGEEYLALFNTLGDMELSILARIVFIEEIRNNPMHFSLQNVDEQPMEMEWQVEYAKFLHSLSTDKLKSISQYIHSFFQTTGS